MTTPETLEAKIQASGGNPALMLRREATPPYLIPLPEECSNWRDEQQAWNTAILYDQSFHMFDTYFKGPDVKRLFSDYAVNDFTKFGRNKAKQFVAVNSDGKYIADAILFGINDDEYSLVGVPGAGNYMQYRAETGDYDVKVVRDDATPFNPNPRFLFRYQLQGPNALKIVEKAVGGPIEPIKFFNIGEFVIAGTKVRALNHTMIGLPGVEKTGLEMWLPAAGFESHYSLGGSLYSENIEDYYVTPYDLGYGRVVDFDHEFHGKEALQKLAAGPHKRKVWLIWNPDDVARVVKSSLFDGADRAKFIDMPSAVYSIASYDEVLKGDRSIGFSAWSSYLANHGAWVSTASIDETDAIDEGEVTVVWGDEASISYKPRVEAHKETTIRATISTTAPA